MLSPASAVGAAEAGVAAGGCRQLMQLQGGVQADADHCCVPPLLGDM